MGRKSKYESDFPARALHMLKWDGLTHEQVAKSLGITTETFYQYIKKYSDFSDAIKEGDKSIVTDLENALYKRALGYQYDEVHSKGKGDRKKILKVITKEVVASETAAIFLLTNKHNSKYKRDPDKYQNDQSIQSVDFKYININEYSIIPEIELFRHQIKLIHSKRKWKAMVAGYGSGKTFGGAAWCLDRIKERKGKGIIGVYAPTYRLMEDVNIPEIRNFLVKYKIPHTYRAEQKKFILTGELRGEIWFRSMDDPNVIIGYQTTDTWLDEFDTLPIEKQKQIWTAIIQRNRKVTEHGGDNTIIITTTPEGFRYTYELVQNGTVEHIKARTDDNIYLPDSYIENFISQFDPVRLQQARNGEFVNLTGLRAYYGFDQNKHVTGQNIRGTFPTHLHCGIDFNVDPMTAVIGYTQDNVSRYGAEYWIMNSNTYQMRDILKRDFAEHQIAVRPDMTGHKRSTNAAYGITDHQILIDAGFRVEGTNNPAERDRLNMVNWAFYHGKVMLSKDMVHLINDLNQCTVNEAGALNKKDNKLLTHISDALGYDIYQQYYQEFLNVRVYQA
jgi:hypothetical protein